MIGMGDNVQISGLDADDEVSWFGSKVLGGFGSATSERGSENETPEWVKDFVPPVVSQPVLGGGARMVTLNRGQSLV